MFVEGGNECVESESNAAYSTSLCVTNFIFVASGDLKAKIGLLASYRVYINIEPLIRPQRTKNAADSKRVLPKKDNHVKC